MRSAFLISCCLLFSHHMWATPNTCVEKFRKLAQEFLTKKSELLSIYEDQAQRVSDGDQLSSLNIATLEFFLAKDLDQGSFGIRREVIFKDKNNSMIVLFSIGKFYCDRERILGIKKVWLKPSSTHP